MLVDVRLGVGIMRHLTSLILSKWNLNFAQTFLIFLA